MEKKNLSRWHFFFNNLERVSNYLYHLFISYFFFPDVKETGIKTISLAPIDIGQMEKWLFAIESTRHTITLPMSLAIDFANLTSQKLDVLNDTSVMEFYKLLYNRIVKFTSFIGVFTSLSTNDRKVSNLEKNDMILIQVLQIYSNIVYYRVFHLRMCF